MDVGRVDYSADFKTIITNALSKSRIFLVLIGSSWIGPLHGSTDDYVRQEIQLAFELRKRIIPVLVQGAVMPRPGELPDELRELAFQNAVSLTHKPEDADVNDLVKIVKAFFTA